VALVFGVANESGRFDAGCDFTLWGAEAGSLVCE
jgi:hypothetical protein